MKNAVGLQLTETVLRDAQQSLFGGRMRTADMLPVLEQLDRVGYGALDAWGGGTYEACLRYLGEDPWTRLRELKSRLRRTPLQMLLRGQALVGRQHCADEVVRLFIERAAALGVDIFRIYDPLNDLRNLVVPVQSAKAAKRLVQGALIYSESPVHSLPRFAAQARELAALGCDAICLVDPSGLLVPATVRALIRLVRESTDLPLHFNANCTSGLAPMAYLVAVEAGAQGLDTALSSVAWGASQPATETIAVMLAGSPQDPKLDLELLSEINHYFDTRLERYHDVLDPIVYRNDIGIVRYQLPATQLAEVLATLRARHAADRLPEVLKEVPRVRQDMGYPPLAAPITDIVTEQAVLNVVGPRRYTAIAPALRDYCRGLFGRPPGPLDDALREAAIGSEEAITIRPADLMGHQLDEVRAAMRRAGMRTQRPEDVLSFLLVPEAGGVVPPSKPASAPKAGTPLARPAEPAPAEPGPSPPGALGLPAAGSKAPAHEYTVEVDGEIFRVRVHGPAPAPVAAPTAGDGTVKAPMQGLVFKVNVKQGDRVRLGDVILILEAMKMQNDIVATTGGIVHAVHVQEGAVVALDDPLVTIAP